MKERSRHLSNKQRARAGIVLALALVGLAGCSGIGSTTDLNKGFLDPTAVGRYQKQPLVVPILSTMDRSIDVDDDRFRTASEVRPEDLVPSDKDYAIGRNDLISIAITDLVAPNVETVRTSRVSESGMISLPLVGQVKAVGLTEADLEKAISKAYRDANLIQNAQVSVSVAEARARTFSILGSVANPGQYAILNSEFRLLDALVLARDVNAQGIEYIYVIRQPRAVAPTTKPVQEKAPSGSEDVLTPRSSLSAAPVIMAQASPTTATAGPMSDDSQKFISVEGRQLKVGEAAPAATSPTTTGAAATASATTLPAVETVAEAPAPFEFNAPKTADQARVIRIPYERLRNGDLNYNVTIRPYDMIWVSQPTVGEYYMGGHVARVGVYSLTARKITLKQAIVSAGMFDQIATPARTDIVRRVGQDKEIFVSMDIDKVFAGQQPDIFLKPNDVVTVGTTWWAPFTAAVRGGFRMTYGFGFLYDRNWAPVNNN